MRIRNGTIEIKMALDGRQFDTDLRKAERTSEAFGKNVSQRMGRAKNGFESVAKAAGLTGKEIQELESRMKQGLAADSASRALNTLARNAGLTQKEVRQLEKQMGLTEQRMDKLSSTAGAVGKKLLAVGAAYASWRAVSGIISATTRDFAEFESALVDMGKVTSQATADIERMAMGMDRALGDPSSLVRGYYQTISAGVTDAVAAQELLTTAAKASKAAHLDQAETIKAVTKLMAGFKGQLRDAADATDLLFKTEKLGQTSFAELVPIIGNVASMANMAGASVEEMTGFLAAFTQTAGSTSQAATQFEGVLRALIKPTENMSKAIKALGYESGRALVEDQGLVGAIQKLAQVAENSNFELGKLFESSEALTGLGPALNDNFAAISANIAEMAERAGVTDKAFREWQGTFQAAKDTFDSTIRAFSVEFGAELAPQIMAGLNDISDWARENKDDIVATFEAVGIAVRVVADAVDPLVQGIGKLSGVLNSLPEWAKSDLARKLAEGPQGWLNPLSGIVSELQVQMERRQGDSYRAPFAPKPFASTTPTAADSMRFLRNYGSIDRYAETTATIDGGSVSGDSSGPGPSSGVDEAERAAKELLRIREDLTRDLKKLTLDEYEYSVWALEQEVEKVRESDGYIMASAETRAEVEKQLQERLNLELAALDQERAQSYKDTMEAAIEEVRQMVERQAGARRDLATATGDVSGYYEAELDLLNMQLDVLDETNASAEEHALVEQQINQIIAERDLDRQALMMEGIAKAALDNHKALADAYRNLPSDAFDAFGSAAKDAFSGIIDGSKSAAEAFEDMGQSILESLADMLVDIAAMEIKSQLLSALGLGGGTGGLSAGAGSLIGANMFKGGSAPQKGTPIGELANGATSAATASSGLFESLGSVLGPLALVGGVVGLVSSLFGDNSAQKRERDERRRQEMRQPLYQGQALSFGGGNVSGIAFTVNKDGSINPTLPGPGDMKALQEEWNDRFYSMEQNARVLQLDFDRNWQNTFSFFSGLVHQDLAEWSAFVAADQAARHAVGELSGAIEYFRGASESSMDVITRLGDSMSWMLDGFSRAGVDLDAIAGITDRVLLDIAESMSGVGESAEVTADRLDRLRVQVSQLARAQYADLLVEAVGGEENFKEAAELFATRALNALERAMAAVEYSEANLRRGLAEAETKLPGFAASMIGDSTEAFWDAYAEAMTQSMPPSLFSWWTDLAQDVAALEDARRSLAQTEFEDWQFERELEYRRLLTEGREAEAEQIDYLIQKEAELAQARVDGMTKADQAALIEVQIAEMEQKLREMTGGAALSPYEDALDKLTNSIRMQINAAQEQASVARSVRSIIDDLLLGDESTLTPDQQFNYARDQYSSLYSQVLAGDAQAGADAASMARDMLRAAQNSMANPEEYDVLFARTIRELGVLAPQAYDELQYDELSSQTQILQAMYEAITQDSPNTELLSNANELLGLVTSGDLAGVQQWMDSTLASQGDEIGSGFAGLILAADTALTEAQYGTTLSEEQRDLLTHLAEQTVPREEWATYIGVLTEQQSEFVNLLQESIDARRDEMANLLAAVEEQTAKHDEMAVYFEGISEWLLQQTNIERYQSLIRDKEAQASQVMQFAMFASMAGVPSVAVLQIQEYQSIQEDIADLQRELAYWTDYTPDVRLARGGIVTGPTIATIAEGGQPEMVLPLDPFTDAMGDLKNEVRELRKENLRMQQLIEGNTRASANANAKTARATESQAWLAKQEATV